MPDVKCWQCSKPLNENGVSYRLGDDVEKVVHCPRCNTEFGTRNDGKPIWWMSKSWGWKTLNSRWDESAQCRK